MEKRRQAIVDLVEQMGEVSIKDLRELFPTVSEVTLRKDLRSLDEEKKLVRVHGGVKSILDIAGIGTSFSNRKSLHQIEKSLIGKKAAELLENTGSSIYISSGTTCAELAKNLPQRPMYVFTDGILVAMDVPATPDIYIELLGGTLDRNIMRLKGPMVLSALEELRFDWAFIGTPGFHPNLGFSCNTPIIAATMSKVIEHSNKVAVLMDSSKVNYAHTPRNIPLQAVDYVISDGNLPEDIVKVLEDNGITVL